MKVMSGLTTMQPFVDDTHLGDHKCLDFTGVGYVRTDTEIHHWSTTIHSGGGAVGDLSLDQVLFVSIVLPLM